MPAAWFNATTSIEGHGTAQQTAVIGIAPRAVMLDGYWRDIADAWQQGDADLPHLVSQAPIGVATADSGRRRLYPVPGDLSRYVEIGAPMIKPAGSWVSVGFAGATRTGNRITWSRPQANLSIVHGGHFCKLDIELRNGYVPPNRQFAFPVSLVGLVRQGAQILIEGKTNLGPVMLLRPPVVYDAANPENVKPIDWQFGAIGGQTGVLFTLPSLAGMARPVVDPTLASQPAAAEGKDVFIHRPAPLDTYNNGVRTTLDVGRASGGWVACRPLLYFSLAAISSTANCQSATLQLTNVADPSQLLAVTVRFYALLSANGGWIEGTKDNALAGAGEPCWNAKAADGAGGVTTAWAGSVGCGTAGVDYNATQMAEATIGDDPAGTSYNWALTPAVVKTWFGSDAANYGLIGIATDEATDTKFASTASSDHATAAYRPLLTIVYSLGTSGGIGRGRHGVLGRL